MENIEGPFRKRKAIRVGMWKSWQVVVVSHLQKTGIRKILIFDLFPDAASVPGEPLRTPVGTY